MNILNFKFSKQIAGNEKDSFFLVFSVLSYFHSCQQMFQEADGRVAGKQKTSSPFFEYYDETKNSIDKWMHNTHENQCRWWIHREH